MLTTGNIKKIFDLSTGSVNSLIKSGKIPSTRTKSGRYIITPKDIMSYRQKYFPKNNASIIGFANLKGGVGKSISVISFASTLQLYGYKVLVVDSDPQGNTSSYFLKGSKVQSGQPSILNIFERSDTSNIIYKTDFGIDLIPSVLPLCKLSKQTITDYSVLLKYFHSIIKDYDYILIDTQPGRQLSIEAALASCHYTIIVIAPKIWSIDGIDMALEIINEGNDSVKKNYPNNVLGVVFNMVDHRRSIDNYWIELTNQSNSLKGLHKFNTFIPNCIYFENLPLFHEPLFPLNLKIDNKKAIHKIAWINLTKEILDEQKKFENNR